MAVFLVNQAVVCALLAPQLQDGAPCRVFVAMNRIAQFFFVSMCAFKGFDEFLLRVWGCKRYSSESVALALWVHVQARGAAAADQVVAHQASAVGRSFPLARNVLCRVFAANDEALAAVDGVLDSDRVLVQDKGCSSFSAHFKKEQVKSSYFFSFFFLLSPFLLVWGIDCDALFAERGK